MRQKRETSDYLNDILDSIAKIEQFTKGMTYNEFVKDEKTVFAVIRAIEVIGEAAKNIPLDFRKKHQDFPWKEMSGTRDKLIHGYFGIDYEVIWKTIKEDLPPLKEKLERLTKK